MVKAFRCVAAVVLASGLWSCSHAADTPAKVNDTAKQDVFAGAATRPAAAPATRPAGNVRVLIVSVDGLRPDLLLRARTPTMHALFESGSYTFWAQTVPASITLPSHTSMITGITPRRHQIEWNRDLPTTRPIYPTYPTVLALATKAGYSTAIVAGKSKFDTLAEPKTVDFAAIPTEKEKSWKDEKVAQEAIDLIEKHQPQLLYVHFPGADNAGHSKGWGTPEQIAAIEKIDELLGDVFAAISEAGLAGSTVTILSADHGGAGKNHGPEDARSRHIPWIIRGPGIAIGRDLTMYEHLTVRTEDTFATACYLLGLRPTVRVDGKPVYEAFTGYRPPKALGPGFAGEPDEETPPTTNESTELLKESN